ncbi:MAG: [protein-PII] uridylyltransferase [Maricaulis sp.]|nr:[protein-PII] uridylyltransferase [Maricaulis sp.]HAQ34340.1 [protein-PII] uridylyltransferase [Alphaproteobacteria bacterium]
MSVAALPLSLDGLRLRAEIAAALGTGGWSDPAARLAALAHLKAAVSQGRDAAFARLEGDSGGLEAARFLAHATDAALETLFAVLEIHNPDGAAEVSLCAIGGYGAGELAPSSDIDLLFLKSDDAGEAADAFISDLVYGLWDMGLIVGGAAARTTAETLELARENVSERTSLLSLRNLAGDGRLAFDLEDKLRAEAEEAGHAGFVEAKLVERDNRIARSGRSRYTVEPNIKDSKGGLRDLQLMRWLAQFLYGQDAFERWVAAGLLTVNDVERYLRAADFLWTVRFHLHALTEGKDDRLTFDLQPEIASRMGYQDAENENAVERFMRRYFLTAMDVGSLTRLVCAKLEADARKSRPRGLARFLPETDGGPGVLPGDAFILRDGRIDFADVKRIDSDPVLMMRLFEVAAKHGADLHPDAMAAIGRSLRLVDDAFRADSRAARSFFATLLDSSEPQLVLRLMTEAGLLGRYIPEFGDIVARTQFNMYHRYTVDEHTLRALAWLRSIEKGDQAEEHPLASRIVGKLKNRRALHLAVLLHDTGKGHGDQCEDGAIRAADACTRLGLPEDEVALVAWLVRSHLTMSDTAQRRDIGDPKTIIDFARLVGTTERLGLLLLLTAVDIRAVGEGIWNGWKAQLLRDLYSATEAVLADGHTIDASADEAEARNRLNSKADLARTQLIAQMARFDADFARQWASDLPGSYWLVFGPEDRLRHAHFARAARRMGRETSVAIRVDRRRAATEVLVHAPDRDRLFSDIAAALSDAGANIIAAHVDTTKAGDAFDVFMVQEESGGPYGLNRPRARDALQERVFRAACGEPARPALRGQHGLKRRAAAFTVPSTVEFDDTASESATVIEASGRDRPGLLSELARALADAGLSLQAARIDGYGERAVDAFYILKKGAKLTDETDRTQVREALLAILGEEEAQWAEEARSRGLTRARASTGR